MMVYDQSLILNKVPTIDNLFKQFGCRSGPTKCVGPDLNPNCLTLMVFLKDFVLKKKLIFFKIRKQNNNNKNQNMQNCPKFLHFFEHFIFFIIISK